MIEGATDVPGPERRSGRDSAAYQADSLTRQWRAAENHLYPLIMSDPDLYELTVTLVVEALDILRTRCPTVPALIEIDGAGVLAGCPTAQAVRDGGFEPSVAFDAARAQRLRELDAAV